MDKLEEIMAAKRREIAPLLRPVRERELARLADIPHLGPGFAQTLREAEGLGIIAEIKRRSPSAGDIATQTHAPEQARRYLNAGADALSILTNTPYFGGTLQDLWDVTDLLHRHQRPTPCLRKDFMLHPIQIVEAAEAGARAILLIVRALDDATLRTLYEAASLAGLDTLFEIHSEPELDRALRLDAQIIGVNNRDLAHFRTDLTLSETLIPKIPPHILTLSESGIHTPEDAARAKAAGARALLVGQSLMQCPDDPSLDRLLHALKHPE